MSERVIVLTTAVTTGDLDTSDYAHVKVDRIVRNDDRLRLTCNIKYGNVVGGDFVEGAVQPPESTYPARLVISGNPDYSTILGVQSGGAQAWRRTQIDAIYQHLIDNALVAGTIQTVA